MTEMYLRQLYYDPKSPVAYTSEMNLWRQIKNDKRDITLDELKKWLDEQSTYTLHKTYNKPSVYRKTMVRNIDSQWQADLVEMREFSDTNDGYNYMLTVIDCFSKYVWVEPLKTKFGLETSNALEKIFETGRVPLKVHFDEGKEFYNRHVKKLLESRKIEYFSTFSDKKAAIVERFNRTLKSRMYKYFTENETRRWTDVVQSIVNGYNNCYHSTIKMTPVDASKPHNTETVWWNIYGHYVTADYGAPVFKVEQTVRISKYKSIFDKGYLPNFTEEYFKIKQILIGNPIVYKLEDLKGEEVKGIFYECELSAYNLSDETQYKIEKVLDKKTLKGKKIMLVKYKGWPDKFNEWIPQSNVDIL